MDDEANKKTKQILSSMEKGIIGGVSALMIGITILCFTSFIGGIYGFLKMFGLV